MPTRLLDTTTPRRPPADVTRRAILRLIASLLLVRPAFGQPTRFDILPADLAASWWRCGRARQALCPG